MEFLQSKESGTSDRCKYKSNGAENNNGAYLVWEDLTVVAQNLKNGATKKLVSGLSGYAEPDRIMAIIGPSGSGKTTLLDALAGRLSTNTLMTGNILLNGKKAPLDSRDVSYVTQDDYFLGTLSVREILTYSAHLRLPSKMTNNEIDEIVQETIVKMGLQDCAEKKIGNWHLRGISTGEKRRLSIGVEILTQPQVLFLDEPTSGLDSASAFFVLLLLSSIAHDGRIVVCSVHQPSSHLFDLFDDLLLLSNGETIYFGDAKLAVKFFAEAGFPCQTRRNPSDHFLRCINSDFDKISTSPLPSQRQSVSTQNEVIPTSSNSQIKLTTEEIKARLVEKYKDSDISKNISKRVQELALSEQVEIVSNKSNAGWWKQLRTLSGRSFLNMSRDMGYYWLRTLFYILVSVSAGNLYFNIGLSYQSILQRAKCDAFVYGFMSCLSIGGLPFFLEEFKVSYRERISGHYGDGVFVLSNFLSSFPFLVMLSTSSGTIIYYMVKLHRGISCHAYFCINLFCCISIVETYMMVVALLVPNVLMGIAVGTCVVMLMMMASEMFKPEVTVKGARSVSLRHPIDLPLPLNRTNNGFASGLLTLAEQLRHASRTQGASLLSLRIVGPTSLTAPTSSSSSANRLKLKRLAPGLVELSSHAKTKTMDALSTIDLQEEATTVLTPKHFATMWPIASVNGSNPNLVGLETLLSSVLGPKAKEKGSFKLLKADVLAQTFVKIGFGVEKKLKQGDEFNWEGFPEWRTKPETVRMHFEVLGKVDGEKVIPEKVMQVDPVVIEDSIAPSVLTGNKTMSQTPIVYPPLSPFSL